MPARGTLTPMDVQLPALSNQDDSFALAVIEYGGNLGAAWRSVFGETENAASKARLAITRPEIAKRIHELTKACEENALISLGSHLTMLAEIRDQARLLNMPKAALDAEVKRGEAAGFYHSKVKKVEEDGPKNPSVVINIGRTPVDVTEWASNHGKQPVVIDV